MSYIHVGGAVSPGITKRSNGGPIMVDIAKPPSEAGVFGHNYQERDKKST